MDLLDKIYFRLREKVSILAVRFVEWIKKSAGIE